MKADMFQVLEAGRKFEIWQSANGRYIVVEITKEEMHDSGGPESGPIITMDYEGELLCVGTSRKPLTQEVANKDVAEALQMDAMSKAWEQTQATLVQNLEAFAASDGLGKAAEQAERWRNVLEEVFEACGEAERAQLTPVFDTLQELVQRFTDQRIAQRSQRTDEERASDGLGNVPPVGM